MEAARQLRSQPLPSTPGIEHHRLAIADKREGSRDVLGQETGNTAQCIGHWPSQPGTPLLDSTLLSVRRVAAR